MPNVRGYYNEYHGHTIDHLKAVAEELPQGRGVIYLVGDSTLDNKYWLQGSTQACNGYERVLQPKTSVPDVAYWINRECEERGLGDIFCCINAAIEESTLGLRHGGKLLPQDVFVQQTICEKDIVVVSMGGNDIALRPTLMTIISMIALIACPRWLIELGIAPGLGHFVSLFRDATTAYLNKVCQVRKPRAIVPCMLYYLDERAGGSWADGTLEKLGYNKDPAKLQLIMREVYRQGVQKIKVDGVPVVPVPLYEALDGKDTNDYVQRVEPSSQGGEKIAKLVFDRLQPALQKMSANVEMSTRASASPRPGAHATAASPTSNGSEAATAAMPDAVHLRRPS